MTPEKRRSLRRFFLEIRALLLPLGTYWLALLVSLGLFTGAVAVFETLDHEGELVLLGFWLAATLGVGAGQLLAILRLRTTIVLAITTATWLAGWLVLFGQFAAFGDPTGIGEELMMVFVIVLFFGPLFLACGLWSLTTHMDILATWAPLVWLTGAVIVISEKTGAVDRWHAGDKWAVWSVLTAPLLGVGVLVVLAYLAARELHRLHRWRTSPRAPDLGSESLHPGFRPAAVLPGLGTLGVLVLLGLFLTLTTAFIAPFLWRTGPGDRENGESGPDTTQEERHDEGHRAQEANEREDEDSTASEQGISARDLAEKAQQAAKQAAYSLLMLFLLLLLALLGVLVFGPPLRRMFLLQHLRRPFWPVPPTRRIQQSWRLVEIALGDLGVYRQPGDSAKTLAERACSQHRLVDPDALVRCANAADRVVYGMGVLPHDEELTRRTAEMTYQAAWDELSETQKFRAVYRFL